MATPGSRGAGRLGCREGKPGDGSSVSDRGPELFETKTMTPPPTLNDAVDPWPGRPGIHGAGQLWRERLISAREDERRRLGRDLHDTLGATLAGIRLRLETAGAILGDEPEARRLVTEAAHEAGRLIDQIRCVVGDLRPPDFADSGLSGALRRLAARLDGAAVTVTADVPDRLPPLPPALELAAYRIASESLANALRHASASTVTVRLAADGRARALVLETVDDGIGAAAAGHGRRGTGLASITLRAEELGGNCAVLPRPDGPRGTLVRAVLPWGCP